jgi:hypothetical protein
MQDPSVPFVCVWQMKCCLTSLKRRQQQVCGTDWRVVYDKVLDEHNLLEEVVVQLADERRYENC